MRVMILAAGRGERLRPLTDTVPKAMVRAGGKPLIAWHLERLAAAGYGEVVINVSHLADRIVEGLSDGKRFGVRITYSREREPLETAGGIAKARALLGEAPFLLVNADIYCEFDFARLRCVSLGARLAHLVLVPNPPHRSRGDFTLEAGTVGDGPEPRYTYAGIAVMSPTMVAGVASGQKAPSPRCCTPPQPCGSWAASSTAACGRMWARASASPNSKRISPLDQPSDETERRQFPPSRAPAATRAGHRRGRRARADRARAPAQPRHAFPLPLRQPFLLPQRLRRARGRARPHRPGQEHPLLPQPQRGARNLGRLPPWPASRARALRLRRGLPHRGARREDDRAAREPAGAALPGRRRPRVGCARHALAERGARQGPHRHHGARSGAGRARPDRQHAPGQGRAGARGHASGRAHRVGGAPARHAGHAAGPPRVRDRGRAAP